MARIPDEIMIAKRSSTFIGYESVWQGNKCSLTKHYVDFFLICAVGLWVLLPILAYCTSTG
jgi:hypothetical protein